MTYSNAHPVRLDGGRLVLDFVNTANWSADGQVVSEKIERVDDLKIWLDAVGLPDAIPPDSIDALHGVRRSLRRLLVGEAPPDGADALSLAGGFKGDTPPAQQLFLTLAANSAVSILVDQRERERIKMCPGVDCGWLFIDETRNSRRKWCSMETCGNRAKSARHYLRNRAS